MFCSNCGEKLVGGAAFCSNCGTGIGNIGGGPAPAPPSSGGNSGLRAFGVISMIAGPAIAAIMGFNAYNDAYSRYAFIWGGRGAGRHAQAALEQMFPQLLMVAGLGIVIGIVFLIAAAKK